MNTNQAASPEHSDVVIVGAGPAGAATSLFLSKEKIPHTIIDKSGFPRDKVCGDALSGKVVDILNRLDPALIKEIDSLKQDYIPSYGVTFVAPNRNPLDIPFSSDFSKLEHAPGFIAKRIDFDNWLFNKLPSPYCQIKTGQGLEDIRYHDNGVQLTLGKNGTAQTLQAKIVVGAEGDRSIVARQLGGYHKDLKHYCAGLRAYYEGVSGMHEQNFIELHFIKDVLPGYFWIFPLPNGMTNVGIGMLSSEVSKHKVNLKQVLQDVVTKDPIISPRFKNATLQGKVLGWGLPLGSKKMPLSGNHFLLTGDAGSLIDPFTGEGIGNAMLSGMVAAQQIKSAREAGRYDAQQLGQYDEAVYGKIWNELKLSHTLQKLVKYPWLFNMVVNKARKNKTLQETFMSMFEDLNIRAKLKDPRFYLKLVFN